jgi:cellulose synthase/poly-beta-1,6-N-acetylglucosamine synthase-like glycosyltransferase
MTSQPNVSLVIVSRNRPDDLKRVLSSLRFQTYTSFEVIVVSNHDPEDSHIKYVRFDEPNICAARNIGINHSAGSIVAFCDDDAIPEPEWLSRLVPAFDDMDVGIAGGFVRGRNGISFQWMGIETDQFGMDYPLEIISPVTRGLKNGRMLKVQGTNCAFRKQAVVNLGGFDEGFAFYLDETDLSWRMTKAGWKTKVIPNAQVQHGFAPSELRGANRAPKSLFQIGKSKSAYLHKHAAHADVTSALVVFRNAQRQRLSRFLVWGQIEPRDVTRLMSSLDQGLACGTEEKLGQFANAPDFKSFPTTRVGRRLVYSGIWRIRGLMKYAKNLADQGYQVTAFCFSRTSKFHNRYFDSRGFWVQRGGIFGKSDRKSGYINLRMISTWRRVQRERDSLSDQRPFENDDIIKLK